MSSASETPTQKQCRVKTSVVLRIQKELQRYHEDLEAQKQKVSRMREAGDDEYDIKKQVEVQAETEVMIPDTMRRLAAAVQDLEEFIALNAGELEGSSNLSAAKELLAAVAPSAEASSSAADDDRI